MMKRWLLRDFAIGAVPFLLIPLAYALLLSLAFCGGCASEYQLGSLRHDMWNGDKALWHDQKFQNERIQTLEKRVYHLERGELLDRPLRRVTDNNNNQ